MGATPEVIERPLTREELGKRYRDLCADPLFANLPGKVELDVWGRMILMSPASNYHGVLQGRLCQRLAPLGGQALVEASVVTSGVLVADVAWESADFMRAHGAESPFTRAPELCIEIASPSNSVRELREKVDAYLAAGATEAWVVYPQSKRFEFFGGSGSLQQSVFAVDLAQLFD